MKLKINICYKTQNGTELPSFEEALLADCLEQAEFYLEGYKVIKIVAALHENFAFARRAGEENETIGPSESDNDSQAESLDSDIRSS